MLFRSDAYRPTKTIIEFVQTRDGTCRMWGCSRPVEKCDLDHVRPWPDGSTRPDELAGLRRGTDGRTDYGRLWEQLRPALQRAARRAVPLYAQNAAFLRFRAAQAYWLPAWCRFAALREANGFVAPDRWTTREAPAGLVAEAEMLQFLFAEQIGRAHV